MRAAFLEWALINLILGDTNNHAKNHSLICPNTSADRPQLALFYDIVQTLLDEQVTHQLSFDIGSAQMIDERLKMILFNLPKTWTIGD